jgi:predicted nucleic-acid-binding Zn-ribbon protein
MRTGTCPKCAGTEVYAARNGLSLGEGAKVQIRQQMDPGFRGMAARHVTDDVWVYACAACGYTETYVHDPAAIEFIRQRWVRIQPQG